MFIFPSFILIHRLKRFQSLALKKKKEKENIAMSEGEILEAKT